MPNSLRVCGMTIAGCLFTAVLTAHPFHVSVAEIEYQAASRTLEVALRLFPEDLETALRRRTRRRVDIERTRGIDREILSYLRERFIVTPATREKNPAPSSIRWIGKEVNPRHAWLYFEVVLDEGTAEWTLANRVLFDVLSDQENTVRVKDDGERYALAFTRHRPSSPVRFDPRSAPTIGSTNRAIRVKRSRRERREQPWTLDARCTFSALRRARPFSP